MRNITEVVRRLDKVASDNSPLILTAFGVTGVVATAYLTGKASIKAHEILKEDYNTSTVDRVITKREKFELVWKLYIPAVGVGSFTIVSIIMANRVGTRRAAAMASAFAISERAFDEYKEKVVEQVGKNKEEKIRADVQQDRVTKNPPTAENVIVTGGGAVLCKDAWSGRYFQSDMETIKKAQNDTNHELLNQGYASLSEFYNRLGLENTKESDNVGWNSDDKLEVFFTTAISDKQEPVLVMDFSVAPIRNFFRTH